MKARRHSNDKLGFVLARQAFGSRTPPTRDRTKIYLPERFHLAGVVREDFGVLEFCASLCVSCHA